MPKYKLTYFNLRALGEPIRYLLSYLGEDFEDIRHPRDQWYDALKKQTPFGKMPTLEVDGEVYFDSVAISRYLGSKAGLAGDNPLENLHIDQVIGAVGDLIAEMRKVVRAENDEAREKFKKILISELIPFYCTRFEKLLQQNNGYLANGKLSWGDLYFVAWSESLESLSEVDLGQKYPHYKALKERVQALPGIKKWIEKRPETKL